MVQRIVWLDAVKGMCMLSIMIAHSCGIPVINVYLNAGFVSAFFVLSGFTLKPKTVSDGTINKAKSLLIPYFFYGILGIFVLSIRDFIINGLNYEFCISRIIGLLYSRYCLYPPHLCDEGDNVFFLRSSIEPLWFLTCMFLAFIWVYIFLNCNGKYRKWLFGLYFILPFGGTLLPILLPWSLDSSFLGALFIILGVYLKKWFLTREIVNNKCIFGINSLYIFFFNLLFFLFLTDLTGGGNFSISLYGNYGILGYLSFILLGLLKVYLYSFLFMKWETNIIIKFLAKLGRISLRLMCIHMPVFVILGIIDREEGFNKIYFVLASLLGIIVTIVISFLIDRLNINKQLHIMRYV